MVGVVDPGPGLRLCLAGEFTVRRDGRLLPAADVGSRKARTLLKLLAVEPGWHSPDQVVAVLWPGRPPRLPDRNLATLVSRVRAALGPTVIDGGREGYRLGRSVEVDLDVAGAYLAEAERRDAVGQPSLAATAAERAVALLGDGGVLLEEGDAEWLGPVRAHAADLLRQARHRAARAALALGGYARAATLATAAIAADPYDEEAYRLLMRAASGQGQPARALATYQRLRDLLANELGVDPDARTRQLHLAILREQPTAPDPDGTPATDPPARDAAPRHGDPVRVPALPGRDAEVDLLAAAWHAAAGGTPGLVLISGEAGIGKTRLAEEVTGLAGRTGGTVLTARCYETERSLFLQPVLEALGRHASRAAPDALREAAGPGAATLAALVPEFATLLTAAPAVQGGAEIQRRRAYDAVAGLLHRLAATPLLLFLDDLHNAGLSTVELLHYLARRSAGARLLVVATLRTDEGAAALRALGEVAQRVDLGPLDPATVTRIATDAGHADRAGDIVARTGGHPLYVIETLRALSAGEAGIPVSLRAAVLGRVARTGADTERVLRAASVLGATIDPGTLAALLEIPAAHAARCCEEALAARLVTVAGRDYEFGNDLIREVLCASTPEPTRVAYHRRAADLLADRPEAVAEHAAAGGDLPRAARAFLLAGEQAAGRFAAADARDLLTRALALAVELGDAELAGRAHLARGRVREALATYSEAMADFRAAADLARQAGDRRLEMMALRERGGDVAVALGLPAGESAASLHAGLRLAATLGDRPVEADVLARLAVLAANRLRFDDGLAYGQRAVRLARRTGEPRTLAVALDGLKTGYAFLGETVALREVLDELEPLLRKHNDLWRLSWAEQEAAYPAIAAGDFDAALGRLEEACEINRRSGYTAYEGWFASQVGWVHRLRGDLDAAAAHGRRALAAVESSTHAWWRAAVCAHLAATLLITGDRAEALALLAEGCGHADREGAEAYLAHCLALLADATGDGEVLARADALLTGVRAPAGTAWLAGAECYLAVGRAWLRAGEPGRAATLLGPLRSAAARTGWVWVERATADLTASQPAR